MEVIYLIRGILYVSMGVFLLVNGRSEYPLADVIFYFALFFTADAGILLFMRRRVHIPEIVFDLLLVVVLFSGYIDTIQWMIHVTGAWYVVSGISHVLKPRRPGLSRFLVVAVGVVLLLFGTILFFREGMGMAGFMGMCGIFLFLPGIIMLVGPLAGRLRSARRE